MKQKTLMKTVAMALLAAGSLNVSAQTSASDVESKKITLYSSVNHSSTPYRIPAIATMSNGEVIAIADHRPCGADVGNGEVDIYAKISTDNGATWSPSSIDPAVDGGLMIADGTSSNGYGDAAVVANRETGEVMVICVSGNVVFSNGSSSKHNKMARLYSSDYGKTWSTEDVTTAFFDNLLPNAYTMFMASGRILQSTKVKVGDYYRLYGALLVRQKKGWFSKANYNYVVYSDDFGKTWSLLGSSYCIESGDEAKLEELNDGTIVISSRKSGGRYFNVFTFSNLESASGSWGSTATCTFAGSNSTNGELMIYRGVTNVSTGETADIILQSLPTGSSRSNVAVYYKTLDANTTYSSSSFTSGWTKGIEVDDGASGYSTMTILPNGEVGFLYEDNYDTSKADGDYFDIVYVPLTVSEITGGAYTVTTSSDDGGDEEEEEPVVETVETPVINPASGEVEAGTSISITCATDGASIYYTVDGSEPTTSSTAYTGEFAISEACTVKALAVKDGCYDSSVACATFTIKEEEVVEPEEPETPEETGMTWTVELKSGSVDGNSGYVATFSASTAVTLPDGVTAYVVTRTFFKKLYTSAVSGSTIPANTGVILYSATGGEITVSEADENATVASISTNKLVATGDNTVTTTSSKCFVLQEKSGTMTFVKVSKGTVVAANSAYIEGSSWYSSMTMSVEGEDPETTGIDGVGTDAEAVEYYNLQGVKVENPENGVYIRKQGGKTTKVVIK